MRISARDQARIGQLPLDGGVHAGMQIIPRDWILHAATLRDRPVLSLADLADLAESRRRLLADASRSNWFMLGAGGHMVWLNPESEAVVVARWLDPAHAGGLVRRVAQVLKN